LDYNEFKRVEVKHRTFWETVGMVIRGENLTPFWNTIRLLSIAVTLAAIAAALWIGLVKQ
jgi:hypothetical protein